jgi:hypothetical protein
MFTTGPINFATEISDWGETNAEVPWMKNARDLLAKY